VDAGAFWDNLKNCDPNFTANTTLHNESMLKTEGTTPNLKDVAGVWVALDNQRPAPLTAAPPPPK
jgi:hypothetical protein